MLILLDTALSLLNINEPVYPLDIVRNMRDQRPYMVQNVVRKSVWYRNFQTEWFKVVYKHLFFVLFRSSFNTSLSVSVYLKRMRNFPKWIRPKKFWNKNEKDRKDDEHPRRMGLPLTHNVCMCARSMDPKKKVNKVSCNNAFRLKMKIPRTKTPILHIRSCTYIHIKWKVPMIIRSLSDTKLLLIVTSCATLWLTWASNPTCNRFLGNGYRNVRLFIRKLWQIWLQSLWQHACCALVADFNNDIKIRIHFIDRNQYFITTNNNLLINIWYSIIFLRLNTWKRKWETNDFFVSSFFVE